MASKKKAKKNSLVENINRRKRAGKSRPKSRSTISSAAYHDLQEGWHRKKAKKAAKRASSKATDKRASSEATDKRASSKATDKRASSEATDKRASSKATKTRASSRAPKRQPAGG